jgi:predicted secreted hydrolase
MNRFVLLVALVVLASCAPAPTRNLEPFVERKPDPVLDQAAHRAPVEWWYLNGHLNTKNGPKGFAAAIFQVYLPDSISYNLAQLFPGAFYFGHYSLVDKTSLAFRSAELSSLPRAKPDIAVQTASASEERMDVRLGDWRMTRENDGVYTATFDLKGKEKLEIRMRPSKPEAIHGPGWSGTKETGRMYYYSATRLEISGTLDGEAVTGIAWLDHQWGGGFGGDGGDGSASITPRWDWFALQLDDGRDVMVYRVRNANGGISDQFASIVNPDGSVLEDRNVVVQPWQWWVSPKSGGRYPINWWIKLSDGSSLTVRSITPDQEVESRATAGFNYYEGAVGVGGSVKGVGYMELTGYAPQINPFQNPLGAFGSSR